MCVHLYGCVRGVAVELKKHVLKNLKQLEATLIPVAITQLPDLFRQSVSVRLKVQLCVAGTGIASNTGPHVSASWT